MFLATASDDRSAVKHENKPQSVTSRTMIKTDDNLIKKIQKPPYLYKH